jgi:hypothetical protein
MSSGPMPEDEAAGQTAGRRHVQPLAGTPGRAFDVPELLLEQPDGHPKQLAKEVEGELLPSQERAQLLAPRADRIEARRLAVVAVPARHPQGPAAARTKTTAAVVRSARQAVAAADPPRRPSQASQASAPSTSWTERGAASPRR